MLITVIVTVYNFRLPFIAHTHARIYHETNNQSYVRLNVFVKWP